jgi:hypothetical protein
LLRRNFIDNKSTKELLRPYAMQIVQMLFKVVEELENDTVFSTLQVTPFLLSVSSCVCMCGCVCVRLDVASKRNDIKLNQLL